MIISKGFHSVHYSALQMQEQGVKDIGFLNTTQETHLFPNGYGASIIRGDLVSYGMYELAVIRFNQSFKIPRSKRKRIRNKYLVQQDLTYCLDYGTEVTSDIERFDSYKDIQKLLGKINRLPK